MLNRRVALKERQKRINGTNHRQPEAERLSTRHSRLIQKAQLDVAGHLPAPNLTAHNYAGQRVLPNS
jgi:hypothetical protein